MFGRNLDDNWMVIYGILMEDIWEIWYGRSGMEDLWNIYGRYIAGMSLLACKVKSAGCFLGGVCGSFRFSIGGGKMAEEDWMGIGGLEEDWRGGWDETWMKIGGSIHRFSIDFR